MSESAVIYLGKDIFFAPTVKSAVESLGWKLIIAPSLAALGERAAGLQVRSVVIDLTPLSAEDIGSLGASISNAYPTAKKVAFGPHIQTDLFAAASAAGFEHVLAKGAVAASLPKLLVSVA